MTKSLVHEHAKEALRKFPGVDEAELRLLKLVDSIQEFSGRSGIWPFNLRPIFSCE